MKAATGILGALLLAAVAGAEDRAGAPLEASKQELKSFQADQTAVKNGATGGKLADGLPQLQSPVPGAPVADTTTPAKLDQALRKRQDAQKNWLVDGVGRLEKEGRAKQQVRGGRTDTKEEDQEQASEPGDSDYLLKVYRRQGKNTDLKANAGRGSPSRHDAMAPFLQGWLADSPVRGKFFDETVNNAKPADGAGWAPGTPGLPDSGTRPTSGQSTGDTPLTPENRSQSNPYLQVLQWPEHRDNSPVLAGPSSAPAGAPSTLSGPTTGAPAGLLPGAGPNEKKPPFLAPSDDQKYFPQQKKF